MQAIILAGGLGTRLRSVVADRPKVLAPVGGRPFLAWMLDELTGAGFDTLCLATGYLGEQIREAFGDEYVLPGEHRRCKLVYSVEDIPLGTGGAIRRALRSLPAAPTFVLNGDTFVRPDWQRMLHRHLDENARLSVAVRGVEDVSRYGAVDVVDGRISVFGEKLREGRGLINAGVYLLEARVFDPLGLDASCFSMEADVIAAHLDTLHPLAFVTDSPFLDIGIPEDFARAGQFLQGVMNREWPR